MKYRKLRIAISTVCGIVCLLLIVLWVRSYWVTDAAWGDLTSKYAVACGSSYGHVIGVLADQSVGPWKVNSVQLDKRPTSAKEAFGGSGVVEFDLPHFVVALVCGAIGAVPWMPWRFSLRTLLITTTVVAALLGAVVWALK
jgi:hypothetical protein